MILSEDGPSPPVPFFASGHQLMQGPGWSGAASPHVVVALQKCGVVSVPVVRLCRSKAQPNATPFILTLFQETRNGRE